MRPALLLLVLLVLPLVARAEVAGLAGTYAGAAEAEGMRLELRAARGGLEGRFTDSNGETAEFLAEDRGTAAEGLLRFPGRTVKVRIFREAVGIRMIAIPLDAAGQPVLDGTHALVFLPPGTAIPPIPAGYMPPVYRAQTVDPDSFLISYEFWPPEAVAFGYEGLAPRYRPMIGLFPVVMADVLWKLCASTYQPPVLGEALRGQGVSCAQVLRTVDGWQKGGRFAAFKADVARDKSVVLAAARCARGYTVLPAICQPAAQRVARAAVSLETVAAVLTRY